MTSRKGFGQPRVARLPSRPAQPGRCWARHRPATNEHLTPREEEVLALVGRGLPNKQIAVALGISEKTVKAHLTSVFQRIGVFSRTEAAIWARERLHRS